MRFLEQMDDFLVGRIAFPFTNYLLNRRNIMSNYSKLMESAGYSKDLLKELQLKQLKDVLGYANRWCPFYTKRFSEIGLVPEEVKSLEDIRLIPPLSRQEVIDHYNEMVDIRYRSSIRMAEQSTRGPGQPIPFARFRRHKLVRNISTGTTGTPAVFFQDGRTTALNWAHELRLKEWYGHRPGVKEARLARVSTEYLPNSKVLQMRKRLWHHLILPGMFLSDADYEMCIRKIKEFRPKVLFGITSALTGLADYIRRSREGVSPYRPDLVITWAAPLYEHEEMLLKEVFESPVTNIYGTREVGHVAAICPHGSMHINQEHYCVESVGDAEDAVEGGRGELLITTIFESPMPFIRYRVGDVGEVTQSDCSCGRSLEVLKSLLGRTAEVFITKDGLMIAPNFWCRVFMVGRPSESVERFQVIYRKNGSIRLRIVRKSSYSDEIETDLKRYLERSFRSDIQFEFEYVSKIDPQPSGKYQLVINEMTS